MKRFKRGQWRPAKEFYQKWARLRKLLYETSEYQSFLREVRFRAQYLCEKDCGRAGRHVHHIVKVYDDPDQSVDVDNGMFLCIRCHKKEHKKEP